MQVEQREPRSITTLCSLLGYSRQALYKAMLKDQRQCYEEELLLQQVYRIRKMQPRIGGRKLHILLHSFMQEHGITMGRDLFFDFLSGHQLLVKRKKRIRAITTNSHHWLRKYKNLIKNFIPVLPNQLWVCDITYLALKSNDQNSESKFAYLSLLTDAYSRKIVGFYLSPTLDAKGSIKALQMALNNNKNIEELIHHSDRGVQYCSNDYVKKINIRGVKISMTESGDPLENAIAERVNGILKDELLEVEYASYKHAKEAVAIAVSIYNYQRPHSSISYKIPAEVHLSQEKVERKWKNYYNSYKRQTEEAAYK